MNNNTTSIHDTLTFINNDEVVTKELVLEQIEFTDNLDSANINYLTYLIVG
jgi:hypothetical protein